MRWRRRDAQRHGVRCADAADIGRRLARAIRAHPACVSATRARALLALVAARRVVAGESASTSSAEDARRVVSSCEALAAAVADSDARLATSLFAAASEASAQAGDVEAASALAAKASAAAAGADAVARRLAAAQARRCAFISPPRLGAAAGGGGASSVACDASVFDPESEAFAAAARLTAAASALAVGDSRGAEASLREVARECAANVARGGATTGTAASARILLGATLAARREPKASKEAGKILAKATRGAAVGGVGVSAAAEACARVTRATGLEAKA